MKAITLIRTSVAALAFVVAPSFAADDETVAALNNSKGAVLASQGGEGEFTPAQLGHRFKPEDRLMVTEGAEVTIKYDNDCDKTYKEPGVYTIGSQCVPAALVGSNSKLVPLVGVALGAAYLIDNNRDKPRPISR